MLNHGAAAGGREGGRQPSMEGPSTELPAVPGELVLNRDAPLTIRYQLPSFQLSRSGLFCERRISQKMERGL